MSGTTNEGLWPIELVAAMANERVIGNKDDLPWGNLPEDMEHFKRVTAGAFVVMGRKTLEAISKKQGGRRENLLPGRMIFVLTRNPDNVERCFPGCRALPDIEAVFRLRGSHRICVVGGQKVFEQFLPRPEIRVIHMTRIYGDYHGDAFFPELPVGEWEVRKSDFIPGNKEKRKPSLSFQTLIRNS